MRLPEPHELDDDDERFLRDHDVVEMHASSSTTVRASYQLRLDAIVEVVERYAPPGLVIDLGCAQGNIALSLGRHGRYAVGVDLNPRFLRYARRKEEGESVAWLAASVEAPALRPGVAAAVVLGEILEHVAYPERTLSHAAQLVRPRGVVVATTPNGSFVRGRLGTLASIADRHSIEDRQFQPDADGHLFLLSREELIVLGTGAGLRLLHHRFYQSPPITGWPRSRSLVERVPERLRRKAEAGVQRTPLGRYVSFGQLAVFERV